MAGKSKSGDSANDVKCWDCAGQATERLEEMFVDIIQHKRIERGQRPARRAVFLKQHGAAYGRFEPLPDLADDMKVGVFGMGSKPCWVRFSSDTLPTLPDLKSTLGIGIKLFDVPGPKLFGDGDTADFIMQNHDVFFVDTAEDMCAFTTAGVVDGDYPAYLRKHKKTARILKEMAKPEGSCLTADYWAILPFAFGKDAKGADRYVKYRLVPEGQPAGQPFNKRDYLALDLQSRLLRGDARFKFMVQFRTNPKTMSLDMATERWESEWVQIATLVLPQQDISQRGKGEYGENLSFNIWRTPPEQQPQGSIADARRVVYAGSANQRREANGVTLTEPLQPAPKTGDAPAPDADRCIVTAAIYPPIGVARVGNSKHDFFIGPEVADPLPEKPGFYRDEHGALKRQAARFRIYGLNAKGEAVAELTSKDADIEWHVHLANQKSSWYEFQLAMDIPEAADAPPSLLRNASVADRTMLTIDPGNRKIGGPDKGGEKRYRFDDGTFMGEKVYLGEVRTDEAGRLIVLGGHGKASSYDGSVAITFANNDGWHDDTSDGPVTAKVVYKGVSLQVDPAWIVVAPPNYAPNLKSVRTMWDLMRDLAISNKMLTRPQRPSFENDIRPIFERMTQLQWVNAGFAGAFGWGGQFNLTTPEWLEKLSNPSPANLAMRQTIANNFRHNDVDSWSPVPWPWLYGDAMSIPAAHTPRQNASLSGLQLDFLDQWVKGDFDNDYSETRDIPRTLEDVPVALQPDMLTRAAMEFCLADAFHPGCEMTWPMRQARMYMSAYRVKHAPKHWKSPNYGAQLTPDVLTLPSGPILGGQVPGSITRWMAVPWQTDTASCRAGYDTSYDPYVPTFWPARVPNQVMGAREYQIVMDEDQEQENRLQAFANRANWLEPLGLDKGYTHQINHMIHHFDQMGVVETQKGIPDSVDFPPVMQVAEEKRDWRKAEDETEKLEDIAVQGGIQEDQEDLEHVGGDGEQDLTMIAKVRRFPNGLHR